MRVPSAEGEPEPVGGGRPDAESGAERSSTPTGDPPRVVGGLRLIRPIITAMSSRSSTRTDTCVEVHAVPPRQLVQGVEQGPALRLQRGGQFRRHQGRGEAVLVAHPLGSRQYPRASSSPEHQAGNPCDPLEAGDVSTCRTPCSAAIRANMRDDTIEHATALVRQRATPPGS